MMIRRMTSRDVAVVASIEKECFSQPWSEKSFQDSIEREDTIFLVCEDENAGDTLPIESGESCCQRSRNNITGYVGMYVSFDEANITNVAVSPAYRKRGYGEQLMTGAKAFAKEAKAENIFLEVRVSNEPAISLYKKMGFKNLGIRKNFYEHPVEDAIIMSCPLVNS